MNLHTLKSFHESALSQWNSVAMIIKEATDAADGTARSKTFLDTMLALMALAGKNQSYRDNVVRGAETILHPYFHSRDDRKSPPTPAQNRTSTPSAWQRTVRNLLRVIGAMVMIALLVGAFLLGRMSMTPHYATLIPLKSPTTEMPQQNTSPEEFMQSYFDAVHRQDMAGVLNLCHEDSKKNADMIVSESEQLAHVFPALKTIQTLQVTIDETARLLIKFETKQGKTEQGEFLLKKHQGEWKLVDFDL